MTPELRAARDRIARFLDGIDAFYVSMPEVRRPHKIAPAFGNRDDDLTDTDLRLVLAALDQQPDGLIQFPFPHDMSGEDVERFRTEWDAAQGPERALTVSLDNRTATFRAKPWPDGPPDAAQLDYRAARREQHPPTEAP